MAGQFSAGIEGLGSKWAEISASLGLSEQAVQQVIDMQSGDYQEVLRVHGGPEFSEEIGSLWGRGGSSHSNFGAQALAHLNQNFGLLASQGVRREHVIYYWNLSSHDKVLQWLELNIFRFLAFALAIQEGSWNSYEEAAENAAKTTKALCPTFMGIAAIADEGIGAESPLPNELFHVVMPKVIEEFKASGLEGLRGMSSGFRSMNEYLRSSI